MEILLSTEAVSLLCIGCKEKGADDKIVNSTELAIETESEVVEESEIIEESVEEESETVTMDTKEAVQNTESVELISESSNTTQPDIQETQQENDAVDEQNINDANTEETVTIAYPEYYNEVFCMWECPFCGALA